MQKRIDLPEDWKLVKLEDVCEIVSGKNQSKVINPNGKYPIYGSSGIFGYADEYLCNEGTTVIGRKGTINSPLFVNTKFWNVDTAFGLSPKEGYNNKLLYYFCLGFNFHALDKSTTIPSLAKRDLLAIEIPLPPKDEQKQIVSKIEELFSELDKGIEELKTAQQQLKVYRQAVLKWAFEGKLTNEDVKDAELPERWKWVRFGECHEIKSNLVSPIEFQDSPHIAPDNISKGTARLLEYRKVKEDKVFSPKHHFFKGQILYSKIRPNLAKVIIAPFDGLCSADMYPIESHDDNLYTLYYMLSKSFVDRASNTESRTILPKINQKGLNEIPFPLCSLEEQQQIVQEIESRLSVCDKVEETITNSLKQAEALRQSILKKAFEGELINGDQKKE